MYVEYDHPVWNRTVTSRVGVSRHSTSILAKDVDRFFIHFFITKDHDWMVFYSKQELEAARETLDTLIPSTPYFFLVSAEEENIIGMSCSIPSPNVRFREANCIIKGKRKGHYFIFIYAGHV